MKRIWPKVKFHFVVLLLGFAAASSLAPGCGGGGGATGNSCDSFFESYAALPCVFVTLEIREQLCPTQLEETLCTEKDAYFACLEQAISCENDEVIGLDDPSCRAICPDIRVTDQGTFIAIPEARIQRGELR